MVCSGISFPVQAAQETINDPITEISISRESQITCHVLLEPLQPGDFTSKILGLQCGNSSKLSQPNLEINTSYFIASFYDNTDFNSMLIQYYGPALCSPSTSYGVGQLSSSVDNRISSGSGYSGCNNIYVYDLPNYAGDSASCFANCSSFGSLNDRVSSWRVTN